METNQERLAGNLAKQTIIWERKSVEERYFVVELDDKSTSQSKMKLAYRVHVLIVLKSNSTDPVDTHVSLQNHKATLISVN